MSEERKFGAWAEHFTHEDLAVLCDFQSKRIDALIHNAMFFEEES